MDDLIGLGITVAFFVISYYVGTHNEKKHFAELVAREKALLYMPAVTFKKLDDLPVAQSLLVSGNIVVAGDFFKSVVAQLASFFGLRISVAESMIDRARREAILRMKENIPGADAIVNVRVQSFKIGNRENMTGIEAMAYGTAIFYRK